MTQSAKLTIIVFAYNEESNIEEVLEELLSWLRVHIPDTEIVFVDDGSTDQTSEIAQHILMNTRHKLCRHDTNKGIGAALKTGVRAASAPLVTFIPADGQIEPRAIGALLQAQQTDQSRVVFSVYDHRDDGLSRTIMSWGIRFLIRLIHGVTMNSDGPYLFERKLFDPDQLPPDSFFLNFEFPIRILAEGHNVSTVTIQCRPRISGDSKSTGVRRVLQVATDLLDLRIRRFRSPSH